MDLLRRARRLETRIAGTLGQAAKGLARSARSAPLETLEIVHAIVDAVESEIQPIGRGTRAFPFNRITVSVLAPSREARGRLEAVFAGPAPLHARIVERLRSSGCTAPDVELEIRYADQAGANWRAPEFDLEFAREEPPAIEPGPDGVAHLPRIDVTVLRGTTERRAYSFVAARVDLGRCAEVRDSRHQLIRTNHVAFIDGSDDANLTVSRQHAHIACAATGDVRLYDDGSGDGTGIVRDGRTVPVPRGSRGVRLRSGDEIALGEARIRIKF